MQEYDIYLNGVGYILARDQRGSLLSGSARGTSSDPFNIFTSQTERWKRAVLKFEMGAGAKVYQNDDRYRQAARVDTRCGDLLRGPLPHACDELTHDADKLHYEDTTGEYELGSGGGQYDGFAVRVTVDADSEGDPEIQTVAVLMRRDPDSDYASANNFTVELWDDSGADGRPGAVLVGAGAGTAKVSISPIVTNNEWLPMEDLWRNGNYFWLVCHLAYDNRADPADNDNIWLCVFNDSNSVPIYWAYDDGNTTGYKCEARGGPLAPAWQEPSQTDIPYHKVKIRQRIDAPVYDFCPFRGADNVERLYAAVGCKVMYYDEANAYWRNSKNDADFTDPVTQLLVFNSKLFAAQGPTSNMEYSDGTTEATNWASANEKASCLALHDNLLWRASGAEVEGCDTGIAWAGTSVTVGDPGIPVTAMISHGGKLFCAKPEGIFEIDYPDGYPGTGDPTANLMLDFRTDRAPRPFIVDWHSQLIFPGIGGIFRYQADVLSDIWSDGMDTESDEWGSYIENMAKYWTAACGTTRGILLTQCSPHVDKSTFQLWMYRRLGWHPMVMDLHHAEQVHAVYVQSLGGGAGRVWYGLGHEIYYLNWPLWTDDRGEDDDADFYNDTGFMRLPRFDEDRPEQQKDWHQLTCRSVNLGSTAGGTLAVHYRLAPDGSWYQLGTFTTSPLEALRFPSGSTSYLLDLTLILHPSNKNTETCRVEQLELLYQPLPDTVEQYQFTILAAERQKLRHGGHDPRTASAIIADLSALLDESEPFALIDEFGVTSIVRAVGVSRHTSELRAKPGDTARQAETAVVVTLLKVADSAASSPSGSGDLGP